jgi:hypothetical protein
MPPSSRLALLNGWRDGQDGDYTSIPFAVHGYTETNLVAGWLQRHANVPSADW